MAKLCKTLILLMLISGSLRADVSGLFTYVVVNGEAHITGYPKNLTGHVEIPAEIDGKPVTAITRDGGPFGAFSSSIITSVTIPPTVTTIGEHAFSICQQLKSVAIPDSVTTIRDSAFYQCNRLEAVTFGRNVTSIGAFAFFSTAPTTLVFPSSLTSIGASAFTTCNSLRSISFGEGLTRIGTRAFLQCGQLKSVTIPASVTLLENNCFVDCPLSSAVFLGNAPVVPANVFRKTAPGFRVLFINGKTGYTAPIWRPNPADSQSEFPAEAIMASPTPSQKWLLEQALPMTTPLSQEISGTGIDLLSAYALDLDPLNNPVRDLPTAQVLPDTLAMRYFAGRSDVTYTVQSSADMKNWSTEGVTLSPPDVQGRRTASMARNTTAGFLRVRLVR